MISQGGKARETRFSEELDRHLAAYLSKNDVVPFKTGLYTSMMLAFLAIAGCSIYAVYCLLQAFLKPIVWAILVGTVLFPIKLAFARRFVFWVDDLEKTNTPFILGLAALPWQLADRGLAAVLRRVATKSSLVLIAIYMVVWCFSRSGPLLPVLYWLQRMSYPLDFVISYGSAPRLLLFMIFYFSILCTSIKILGDKVNKIAIRALSVPIWFSALCYLGNFFGPYRTPVTLSLAALVGAIALDLFRRDKQPSEPSKEVEAEPKAEVDFTERVVGAAVLVFLLKYNYLFFFLALLALCALVVKAGRTFSENRNFAGKAADAVNGPLRVLYEIWIPHQMRAFLSAWLSGSPALYSRLRGSASALSTLVVMTLMLFGLLMLSIFLLVQVSDEMASLTALTSDLLKRTWTNSSAVPGLIEKAFPLSDRDAMINSVYENSRAWISGRLREAVGKENPQRAEAVEAQAQQLVDELYRALKAGHAKLASVGEDTALTFWDTSSLSDLESLKRNAVLFVQTNFALFSTILETVWALLQTNLGAIFALTTPLLWEVFTFGFGIVNTLLQMIMFGSLLYCLLVSSEETWKPADAFSAMLPFSETKADSNFLFEAFQRSVSGVFVITMNMSLFYGLYTWLVCSLFGLSMTVVPSIIAAAVAAVPVAPPWFACLPGVMELWLVDGENMLAILLLLSSILPSLFVNDYIYTKLDDSHPYLTGLSICGGVYWLGLEGAIIGPILLCCVLFIATLYRSFGKSIKIGQ